MRRLSPSDDALPSGAYSVYSYIRERCGQFWGVTDRTMLRDEAYAFLQAGARIEAADMTLRMLRVALPAAEAETREDAEALALLQAVGGFQAFRRAAPLPPNALPVMRFLLYGQQYPGSVAASVGALLAALTAADDNARAAAPVLRLRRLAADPGLPLARRGRRARCRRDARHRPAGARARRRRHLRPLLRPQRRPAAARSVPPACASRSVI